MDVVYQLQFSVNTLTGVMLLPFLYFVYHTKYWYRPALLKRNDFFLQILAGAIGMIVLVKLVKAPATGSENLLLALLHLAPVVLTFLVVAGVGRKSVGSSGGKKEVGEASSFVPLPVKDQVERLDWDDIVMSEELKEEFQSVITLLQDPKQAKKYGIEVPKGILLNGPPGTGKTTIAKAIANTAHLSFFALKMDEVVSKWVGESEKNLTKLFEAAQKHAPSVIFIDEVDSIGKQRSGKGQQWAENLLNHLLQLIDGVVKAEGLYVIAATNRADLVDGALKRAGRLNKVIEIPLPDFESRRLLFEKDLAKLHLAEDIDLDSLAYVTEGHSGADIKEICNQAGLNAFKRESGGKKRNYLVTRVDIDSALNEFLTQDRAPSHVQSA